jgi:hypothetical protein
MCGLAQREAGMTMFVFLCAGACSSSPLSCSTVSTDQLPLNWCGLDELLFLHTATERVTIAGLN